MTRISGGGGGQYIDPSAYQLNNLDPNAPGNEAPSQRGSQVDDARRPGDVQGVTPVVVTDMVVGGQITPIDTGQEGVPRPSLPPRPDGRPDVANRNGWAWDLDQISGNALGVMVLMETHKSVVNDLRGNRLRKAAATTRKINLKVQQRDLTAEKQAAERGAAWMKVVYSTAASAASGMIGADNPALGKAAGSLLTSGGEAFDKQSGYQRAADEAELAKKGLEVNEALVDDEIERAKDAAEQDLGFLRDLRQKLEAAVRAETEAVRAVIK